MGKVVCTTAPPPYIFNIDQTNFVLGALSPAQYVVSYYNTSAANAHTGGPTGLIPDADLAAYSITTTTATVWVRVEDLLTGCVWVRPFTLDVVSFPSGTISYASSYCTNLTAQQAVR